MSDHGAREITLDVQGMTFAHCEQTVSRTLRSVSGVSEVLEVSHAAGRARVAVGPGTSDALVEEAVTKAGYTTRALVGAGTMTATAEARRSGVGAGSSRGGDTFDLAIIGGGSAGFAAAIKGAELGARVALIEGSTLGGTCVNVGCIPSKTLIRAADAMHRRTHHGFAGVPSSDGRPDWNTVRAQKDELVERLRQAKYWDVLRSYERITLLEERGVITSGHAVRLASGRAITAGKIVVATGASPWAPPIPGLCDPGSWCSATRWLEQAVRASTARRRVDPCEGSRGARRHGGHLISHGLRDRGTANRSPVSCARQRRSARLIFRR